MDYNKFLRNAGKVYFVAMAVLMYYFINEVLQVGLVITYRHVFALLLFGMALFTFLLKPNIARGLASLKDALIYSTPLIISLLVSLLIWFSNQVDVSVITRGLSSSLVFFNMFSFTFAAVSFLYIFGEKGIWYNLIAILISNLLMLLMIVVRHGLGPFISEFITLIVTFADNTGAVIIEAEIHELAFCLGAYLIYMLLLPKKNLTFLILLALTFFCFLTAFKRIGIIAIVVTLAFGWFLKFIAKFKKDTAFRITIFLTSLVVIILLVYVALIKAGAFSLLEDAGINTSGRVVIYTAVDKFYEFSPEFMGNGIGFLTYQLSSKMNVGVSSVHNDFLQYFIDLGFWGYILWLVSMTLLRVCWFGAKGKIDNAIITFSLSVYLVIVSSTDNTINYPLLTTVLAIIMIGHGFDEKVRKTEIKIFGSVSDANKEKEGDSIL